MHSSTLQEHAERLKHVFEKLNIANLFIQPRKCKFAETEVDYLGHTITCEGIKPDIKKVIAIQNFIRPENVTHIKSFLGLVGYYRRNIKNFAELAKPLTELLKKETKFHWDKEQENSFNHLKNVLCKEPVLRYPDFSKPFLLSVDASLTCIGAILSQEIDGNEYPIAYASRTLIMLNRIIQLRSENY